MVYIVISIQVLTFNLFMSEHFVLRQGWFEPMAQLVKEDSKIMVMPKVGVIDLDTFEVSIYPLQDKVEVQGFDFFLGQVRTSVRDDYLRSRRTREDPLL